MQKEFFVKQIDRLRGVYSSSSLSEERVQILWDRFKTYPNEQFEKGVSTLIGEYTTQALPGMSRFHEAVNGARASKEVVRMEQLPSPFNCEACRDFGFGWIGETIVPCTCSTGRQISPAELVLQQARYDRAKALFKSPFPELPYDPNKREGA